MNTGREGDWRRRDDYTDSSYLYVLLVNQDSVSSNSRVEDILVKVVRGVVKIEDYLKEHRVIF